MRYNNQKKKYDYATGLDRQIIMKRERLMASRFGWKKSSSILHNIHLLDISFFTAFDFRFWLIIVDLF